jgi:hypothetical protein
MNPEEYDLIPWCLNKGRTARELLSRVAVLPHITVKEGSGYRARGALVDAFDIAGTSHDPDEWAFIQHTALWMRSAVQRIRDMADELRFRDGVIAGRDARIAALEASVAAGLQREEEARASAAYDAQRSDALAATLRGQVDAARADAAEARAETHAARLERDAAVSQARAWEAAAEGTNRAMDIMRAALRIPDGRPLALPGGDR